MNHAWLTVLVAVLVSSAQGDEPVEAPVKVAAVRTDESGWLVYDVQSPYQAGTTQVRVLLPERIDAVQRYPVVYLLPVERLDESRFGDGLREVQKHDLHNRHAAVFVAPTFSHLPWYADHASEPEIRQEIYLLEVVLPLIEKNYPVRRDAAGRLLVGFSKSGWGAFSLLLRHPHLFGRAAAWDAPLMQSEPKRFGMGPIFGSQENFERYQTSRLLERRACELSKDSAARLILTGYGNFRDEHQQAHALLTKLGIRHVYRDGPELKHDWHSGWLAEALTLLFEPTAAAAADKGR